MEYGVEVNNKYDLFLDEDTDPLELLRIQEEEAKNKVNAKDKILSKNDKNVKTSMKKPTGKVLTPAVDQKNKVNQVAQKSLPQVAQKSLPKKDITSEKPPRFSAKQNENAGVRRIPRDDENREQPFEREKVDSDFSRDRTDDVRGRGSGFRRGGRGMPRGGNTEGGGFDRFGKRDFERHSGSDRTGLKPVDKRDGSGAHNWGTIQDDVEVQLVTDGGLDQSATQEDRPANTGDLDEDAAAAAEEEAKQMTLDEWKKMQEQRRMKSEFNIRKPGEGCAPEQKWKKMYRLKKKEDENDDEEEDEEEDQRAKQKNHVSIAITFNDTSRRGAGGRGARRGGRGGPGRGFGRDDDNNPRPDQPARSGGGKQEVVPNVDNELDFPSL